MTDTANAATTAVADGGRARWDDNAGFWIQIIRERRDRYRTELTDQAVLDAAGSCEGQAVLDAGCGEGYLARELARRGASHVTGVDRSPALVDAAAASGEAGLSFKVGDVTRLPFDDRVFDLVVANHVLNDVEDITAAAAEFSRVLKPGGRLIALMLHPCFYGLRAERQALRAHLPVQDYFAARAVEQHFEVDGLTSPAATLTWVRPLEAYTSALTSAGFHLTGLSEPHPTPEQMTASQWWQDNFPRPLFLLAAAAKHA